jgi:hypothetical protein
MPDSMKIDFVDFMEMDFVDFIKMESAEGGFVPDVQ